MNTERRYDIDWIRVIAIGLLLIYHTAIGFQPWGVLIGFITNKEPLESLWLPMTMINVWRIPILFYVSGMGLFLAMRNRNWKQLFTERFLRIGVPLIFGSLLIVPLHWFLLQYNYRKGLTYTTGMGHLWFLGNILVYVVIIAPIFLLLRNTKDNSTVGFIEKFFGNPVSLIFIIALFIAEALLVKPAIYEMYAFTFHGFMLGMIAFLAGFLFMSSGQHFWKMLVAWRWIPLLIAAVLYGLRLWQLPSQAPVILLVVESNCWIFSVFAFACKYLNTGSKQLTYLKDAAYPVYILHMVFLYLGAVLIYPLAIDATVKFVLQFLFTLAGSILFYEFIIRRLSFTRFLFGLTKRKKKANEQQITVAVAK